MSDPANINPSGNPVLSGDEQKQLIINAIRQRFPDTNFREWSYYHVGHLLNFYNTRAYAAYEYGEFFTGLMLFLMKRNLSEAFAKEVGEYPFEMLKNLSHFFQFMMDSDTHYAFIDYFYLNLALPAQSDRMVELAKQYLTSEDLEKILAANPDTV